MFTDKASISLSVKKTRDTRAWGIQTRIGRGALGVLKGGVFCPAKLSTSYYVCRSLEEHSRSAGESARNSFQPGGVCALKSSQIVQFRAPGHVFGHEENHTQVRNQPTQQRRAESQGNSLQDSLSQHFLVPKHMFLLCILISNLVEELRTNNHSPHNPKYVHGPTLRRGRCISRVPPVNIDLRLNQIRCESDRPDVRVKRPVWLCDNPKRCRDEFEFDPSPRHTAETFSTRGVSSSSSILFRTLKLSAKSTNFESAAVYTSTPSHQLHPTQRSGLPRHGINAVAESHVALFRLW